MNVNLRLTFITLAVCMMTACDNGGGPGPINKIKDEALSANRMATPKEFPFADEDFFEDMDQTKDGHLTLTRQQIQGRNMWMVWTGGDDRLWDALNWKSFGIFDLLKTISSHEALKSGRHNRWEYLGLVNEPCFEEAKKGDPDRFGLWLDKRVPGCDPRFGGNDPFANEEKYRGVKYLHRGEEMPVGSFYGYPTGIVGLRLFPNPNFDAKAKAHWDPDKYYNDPKYITKDLVRPYRVGMACAFCHVGPNPLKPPADPNNPKWENLSSNVGAQYFWFDRIFAWQADPANFVFQLLQTYRPGALDTSLVSTDYIDNPRTMNAVYYLGPRVEHARRWGHERVAGGGLNNKQFNDFLGSGPLTVYFEPPDNVWNPRVLKDGSDSAGVLGALNRVYLNIGLYSEEWLRHFNALFGGQKTTPIEISEARENSTYWNVTESWTPAMAEFFLNSTEPHHLADAPGGKAYLTATDAQLIRGKEVFAERCARCHSSKAPRPLPGVDPGGCSGPAYYTPNGDTGCWNKYWAWTKTDAYKKAIREIVMDPNFLVNNYLSSELRVPVTLLQTNACSPLASNAIGGSIWDNFSSETYKTLPSVGTITYYHPVTGKPQPFEMPAGGRGYTRPASLVSLWSTAPYLLNNSVGAPKKNFDPSPSVDARMKQFDIAIRQMLWPETRAKDSDPVVAGEVKGPSLIDRTTTKSYIKIPSGFAPSPLADLVKVLLPSFTDADGLRMGPIPEGTPVGLLGNLDLDPGEHLTFEKRLKRDGLFLKLAAKGKIDLKNAQSLSDDQLKKNFANLTDLLLQLSKCPDLIVNRGHYFGTGMLDGKEGEPGLSNEDKEALIAFLKTF